MNKNYKNKKRTYCALLVVSVVPVALVNINSVQKPVCPQDIQAEFSQPAVSFEKFVPNKPSYCENNNLGGFTYDFSMTGMPDLPAGTPYSNPTLSDRNIAISSGIYTSTGPYQDTNIYRAI